MRKEPPSLPGREWVNTPGYSDYAVAGKPLHSVNRATSVSACGVRRRTWSADLFNVDMCVRCVRALKIQCPACNGSGTAGLSTCRACHGTQLKDGL